MLYTLHPHNISFHTPLLQVEETEHSEDGYVSEPRTSPTRPVHVPQLNLNAVRDTQGQIPR